MSRTLQAWSNLLNSLWDWDGEYNRRLPCQSTYEWLMYVQHDYDEIDRMYVDSESIGGE